MCRSAPSPVIPRLFAAALLLCAAGAFAADLTTALAVRSLPAEQAREKLPVRLSGIVSFVESPGTAFIQDATAGTHIHMKPGRGDLRIGDRVEVTGVTMPGLYLPGVEVAYLRITGHESPPAAVPAAFDDLATGRFHYQRVVVEGVGRTVSLLDENRTLLRLATGSRVIEVRIDAPPESAPDVVDARLHITALAAGGINDRRQLVFPYLRVTDWNDVAVAAPPGAVEKLAVTPVAGLLRFGAQAEAAHRVRVRGTVLASFPDGRLFVRDLMPPVPVPATDDENEVAASPSPSALGIHLITPAAFEAGQIVDAVGFPVMERFSATVVDALVDHIVTADELPPEARPDAAPVPLPGASALLSGNQDADLVTFEARLVDVFRTTDGTELRLHADGASVRAMLPASSPTPAITPGSWLALTGICRVEASTDKGFRSRPERALLLLRNSDDLRIVRAPTWWTSRRLLQVLAILVGVLLGGTLWITFLRRQLARQAATLRSRVASEAAMEERQRIAREFHDTLEQELAGLSLRLDAATTRPLDEKARGLLDASRHLVSRIQGEARNLVADLRDTEHATTLPEALQILASRSPEGVEIVLDLHPIPAIPPHITHHLRMIAQEAITNALKHAAATQITLHLSTTPSLLTLRITDNGRGFDPQAETHGKPGHFGCIGIRERCQKIGASADWHSQRGQGTVLAITLPLSTEH